jgi:hypothetical protein
VLQINRNFALEREFRSKDSWEHRADLAESCSQENNHRALNFIPCHEMAQLSCALAAAAAEAAAAEAYGRKVRHVLQLKFTCLH